MIAMTLVRIIQMKRCTEIVDGWFLDTVRVFKVRYHTTKAKFFTCMTVRNTMG